MNFIQTEIFSDYTAVEARKFYIYALKAGLSDQEAEDYIIEKCLNTGEFHCSFYTALAITQWEYGRLSDKIKNIAIQSIDNGGDCQYFKENKREERLRVLNECKQILLSPMEERKIVEIKQPCRRSPWTAGDIFAYKIDEKKPTRANLFDKYFIFIITSVEYKEREFENISHDEVCAVVINKHFDEVPQVEDIKNIGYLHVRYYNIESRICLLWQTDEEIDDFFSKTVFIAHANNLSNLWTKFDRVDMPLKIIGKKLALTYIKKRLNNANRKASDILPEIDYEYSYI